MYEQNPRTENNKQKTKTRKQKKKHENKNQDSDQIWTTGTEKRELKTRDIMLKDK